MLRKISILAALVSAIAVAPSTSAQTVRQVTPQAAPAAKRVTGPILAGQVEGGEAFRDVDVPQLGKVPAATLKGHAIRPAHVMDVESDKGLEGITYRPMNGSGAPQPPPSAPKVDLGKLNDGIHAALQATTYGYAMQIRKNGQPVATRIWKKARGSGDGNKNWNLDSRMHVASVSKFITAVSMVKMLDEKGVSVDAKILPYLPTNWVKGPNVDKITFRQLLTHTSGFRTGGSASDYATMKWFTMVGPGNNNGTYDYENMNFGLCRILISTLGGVPKSVIINDATYDYITIDFFRKYTQDKLFTPSGVPMAGFAPVLFKVNALAYSSLIDTSGWSSGDLASMAGGAGYRLSVNELLDFMGTFRRKGTIVSTTRAQQILDQGLGLDVVTDTPAGRIYDKNGRWRSNGNTEQSLAMFLPDGVELAVFVNSPIGVGGGDGASLRGTIRAVYDASVK